jgi:hypothetical protein
MNDVIKDKLERRLGPLVAQRRLALEATQERQIFGERLIRTGLKLSGLYWRERANAARVSDAFPEFRYYRSPPSRDHC